MAKRRRLLPVSSALLVVIIAVNYIIGRFFVFALSQRGGV